MRKIALESSLLSIGYRGGYSFTSRIAGAVSAWNQEWPCIWHQPATWQFYRVTYVSLSESGPHVSVINEKAFSMLN